jgi:hypothetical protein
MAPRVVGSLGEAGGNVALPGDANEGKRGGRVHLKFILTDAGFLKPQ